MLLFFRNGVDRAGMGDAGGSMGHFDDGGLGRLVAGQFADDVGDRHRHTVVVVLLVVPERRRRFGIAVERAPTVRWVGRMGSGLGGVQCRAHRHAGCQSQRAGGGQHRSAHGARRGRNAGPDHGVPFASKSDLNKFCGEILADAPSLARLNRRISPPVFPPRLCWRRDQIAKEAASYDFCPTPLVVAF